MRSDPVDLGVAFLLGAIAGVCALVAWALNRRDGRKKLDAILDDEEDDDDAA